MNRISQNVSRSQELKNLPRKGRKGLAVWKNPRSLPREEVFFLDIPFYRTRPSYFVYNRKLADGNWLLVRLGWRYDRNWRGYIGPSFAWKEIPPLLYY